MLSGDNGLLKRAGDARDDTIVGQEKEQVELAYISAAVKKLGDDVTEGELQIELDSSVGNEKTDVSTNDDNTLNVYYTDTEHNYTVENGNVTIAKKRMPIVTTPPTTAVDENTKYKDTNNDVAVIPTGFRVSDNTDEQTIETGLVVLDGNDNEWVWIPVDDVTDMYTTEGVPYTLRGGTGVKTSMLSKSLIISGQERNVYISNAVYREPELQVGNGSKYDAVKYSRLGFESLEYMAQKLVNDYADMITSIGIYGGFYVGRYELSGSVTSPLEKDNKQPLCNINWYELYNACKGFTVNGVVESRMIWGCQWDMVCLFIENHGEKKDIYNSATWGNYYGTAVLSSDRQTVIKNSDSESSKVLNTGKTTFTMANNIYDIAGNCEEWTQEYYGQGNTSSNNYGRVRRGGNCYSIGRDSPASGRYITETTSSSASLSARPILYIK